MSISATQTVQIVRMGVESVCLNCLSSCLDYVDCLLHFLDNRSNCLDRPFDYLENLSTCLRCLSSCLDSLIDFLDSKQFVWLSSYLNYWPSCFNSFFTIYRWFSQNVGNLGNRLFSLSREAREFYLFIYYKLVVDNILCNTQALLSYPHVPKLKESLRNY